MKSCKYSIFYCSDAHVCEYTKNQKIIHFKWVVWYVNYILIKLLKQVKDLKSKGLRMTRRGEDKTKDVNAFFEDGNLVEEW